MTQIKILAFDIDGTLTDGSLYISPEGEWLKVFHVRDGYALKLADKLGFLIYFITGKVANTALKRRLADLGFAENRLCDHIKDKVACAEQIVESHGCELEEIAFMGDDLPDLPLLRLAGISGAPADAIIAVQKAVDFLAPENGGRGAVRSFIDYVLLREGFDLDDQSIISG
ncbi:MAG: HAD hydrolase family protein [Candidatus Caenarcaniphilales bacterium]|nr:HAD hydrolase family protein [Candidatus Caenarcaniphilales bacterium]